MFVYTGDGLLVTVSQKQKNVYCLGQVLLLVVCGRQVKAPSVCSLVQKRDWSLLLLSSLLKYSAKASMDCSYMYVFGMIRRLDLLVVPHPPPLPHSPGE